MKSAITLAQVPEAKAGPFVFHQPLPDGFARAGKLGFDAVELFLPGPDFIGLEEVKSMSAEHHLDIAAVGTGAGMVQHGLSLTDPDPGKRREALDFVLSMIDFGGQLGAPAILGSMQGRWGGEVSRDQSLTWLTEALQAADERAARHNVSFIYEPLNRYETNQFNQLAPAAAYLDQHKLDHTVLLADLFHMNIEEPDLGEALLNAGAKVGHVHFADSNRQAIGFGHTEMTSVLAALQEIGYSGYLSAEIFPLPDADTAARQTIEAFRQLVG
ncbi:MAG: sugar phosphate isomerase/epimerase [Roseibacillus sp.]|nr:sugar phosphate isomerase/epimerase [Roseibacillus sp.]